MKMRENRKKLKELNERNREIYSQTKILLRHDVKKKSERKAVLNEFFELLSDAQKRGLSSEELFPEGYDIFYRDLLSGLEIYSAREKRKRIIRMQVVAVIFLVLCTGIIIFQYLNVEGYIGVWSKGIGYIATDFNNYTYHTYPFQESVSFKVDFSRWEEYENIEICRSGDITVELEGLDRTDGWYRIFFRAHGIYSRDYAEIISWRRYDFDESHTAEWLPTAELDCHYRGKSYSCNLLGFTNMDSGDGEEFSFYVPSAVSSDSSAGIAEFYLRNLTWSSWTRKAGKTVRT